MFEYVKVKFGGSFEGDLLQVFAGHFWVRLIISNRFYLAPNRLIDV